MTGSPAIDRERLAEAVAAANIPTLLMTLVQLTGDMRYLEEPYRPLRGKGLGDNDDGGLPEAVQEEIRHAALHAITGWFDAGSPPIKTPDEDVLVHMLSVAMGEAVAPEYGGMIAAGFDPVMVPERAIAQAEVPPGFRVVIIGAGVSGICMAVKLQAVGIDYVILDKNPNLGGTWLENRYPGAGVDVPSVLYAYSFASNDWSHYFSPAAEIHDYLERVASDFDIKRQIEFDTQVTAATYDEVRQVWLVSCVDADGVERVEEGNVVVSAVGALNRPRPCDIEGHETFTGPLFHSARWPQDLDITGKRMAVIGTGASSMQIVPATAGVAEHITIFQRSPQWAAPFARFQQRIPDEVRYLLSVLPIYHAWYRQRQAWLFNDRIHAALQKDPDWEHPDRSINAINDGHRRAFTRYITEQLGDRQDLLPQVLPTYPPFGKRMLLDNGWFRALQRDDVRLVTDGIERITPTGIVTSTGEHIEVDVIVIATGFDVVHYLASLEVHGRDGATLRERWDDDDAAAYLGVAVAGFPNFYCLYGPNSAPGHGGSLIPNTECQVNFVLSALEEMVVGGLGAIEVRPDAYEDYAARVDAAHAAMIWTHTGMTTYYRNHRGRVVGISPWRNVDYWTLTRHIDL
ncbi:MAG: NAD(P)/FAD-dependent oxidoreductase, partial [Actinomycetia bacterium]|nr:NAD(P)/FAD-dependent oxidoreductase [Actinomycetes bacterium]